MFQNMPELCIVKRTFQDCENLEFSMCFCTAGEILDTAILLSKAQCKMCGARLVTSIGKIGLTPLNT